MDNYVTMMVHEHIKKWLVLKSKWVLKSRNLKWEMRRINFNH